MKRWIILGVVAVVLAGAGMGGWQLWQVRARATAVREAVPPRPALDGWPAEFAARVDSCEQRIARDQDALRALGELGQLYHANGFYAEASACYHGLLRADPKNARWPHAFASILAGYGKLEEAAVLWRQAVALAPTYMPARLRLGDVLLKDNQLDEAAAIYQEALRQDPRQPYALLGVGRVHFARGEWARARDPLEQAASLTNQKLAYDLLPTVYERLGDNARAAAMRGRAKAMGSYADTPDPWLDEMLLACFDTYRLAVASGAAKHGGDRRLAMQMLERALALSPESAPVHFQLGLNFLETKEYTKARHHLEQCTRLAPDMGDGWIHLSILLATVGDRAGSERILAEGLARNPGSPGLHLERAKRLADAGRHEEAIAAYRESFRLRPDEAGPLISIATILINLGREDEAVAELRRAVEAEPDFPPALSILAFHAISIGDRSEAEIWLRRIDLQPRVTQAERERLVGAYRAKFGTSP